MEESKNVECTECQTGHRLFSDDVVTNAWQKGNENHYEWQCTVCDTKNTETIPIEEI